MQKLPWHPRHPGQPIQDWICKATRSEPCQANAGRIKKKKKAPRFKLGNWRPGKPRKMRKNGSKGLGWYK